MVDAGVAAILGGRSLADFNAAYLAAHGGGSLRAHAAAAECAALLEPGQREAAAALLLDGGGPVGAVLLRGLIRFWVSEGSASSRYSY